MRQVIRQSIWIAVPFLFALPTPGATQGCEAIAFGGGPILASISAPGEVDCYTFPGTAGDRILVRVVETAGSLQTSTQVLRPDTSQILGCSFSLTGTTCRLDASGAHRINVRDILNTRTGNYNLYVQRLNQPGACLPLLFGPLPVGAPVGQAGEVRCLTFAGIVGDRIRLRLRPTSGTLDPLTEEITCTLDTSGNHTILVSDFGETGTGAFNVSLQRLNNPLGCTLVSFGRRPVSSSIGDVAAVGCFVFPGQIADRVRLRVKATSGTLEPLIEILRPDGVAPFDCESSLLDDVICRLDVVGVHTILVRNFDFRTAGIGAFNIALQRLNSPERCRPIAFGLEALTGSIDGAAEADCFTFLGAMDDVVRIGLRETSGELRAETEVIGPDGAITAGCSSVFEEFDCLLDMNGTYAILVGDILRQRSGSYSVTVRCMSSECGRNVAPGVSVVAAVLPSSRTARVGTAVTAFATILNAGPGTALQCAPSLLTNAAATFSFQTTDPQTNIAVGSPNAAVDIPPGSGQSFVFAVTPNATMAPADLVLGFDCANTNPAPVHSGLNTLLFSASTESIPDVVALAATLSGDGIVSISGTTGTGVFAVATVNVAGGGSITASADTGESALPVAISLCQTAPITGACLGAIGPTVTVDIPDNATPSFGVFVVGQGTVPFDPAENRVFVRFRDASGLTRGATSVAVRTE